MTNIVTRKGLAFGALVALASTAIAGAPAHAAGEINVVPSAGTSYNIASGSQFTLATTFAPGYAPAAYAQLKYLVKTDANSTVKFAAQNTTTGLAAAVTGATAQAVSTTSAAVAGASTAATDVSYLGLSAVTTSVTSAVEVTAFVDANNDGALTAGEWNTVRTVTFKKAADITPAVTLTQPATGDTSVSATVAWGDLNIEQMANEAVKFTVAGGSVTAGTLASGVWSLSASALASGAAVTAQAYDGSTALGTAASATATARTIATITGEFPATADTATISSTNYVRSNKAFSVKAVVKDGATTPAAVAGVAVVAKVSTSATLSGTAGSVKSITVNGTTYTSGSSNFATVNLTSGSDGYVKLDLASAGLADADTVTVVFSAQNLSATVATTQEADLTYTVTDTSVAPIIATNKNTAVTLTRAVKDQFGVLSSATNQRLYTTQTNATAANQYVAITNGVASFTVTPATDSTADVVVTSVIQSSTTASNGDVTWSAGTATGVTSTIKVRSAAYAFATAPAVAEYAGAAASTSNASQTITQVVQSDSSATGYVAPASNTTYAKITLTGSNAGEALTVTGSGVYLSIDGAAVTADKATKVAQAAAVAIYVASNTVGTKTITITNGTVTKTVDVVFVSATGTAVRATATTFAVAVAAAAQSGRAIDATVTVTDKWGNPVAGFDVTASVSGVAVVNGGYTAAVSTDANGKATVKLSAGVNDLGDAVVTFSDNDVNTTTNVTSVAKTVTFGSTDGYIDVLNGKRASVTWSFAKGKRVAVYLDGVRRYNIVQPGDAELNLQFNLKKGSHSIKLVIGGVIVDTLSVKVAG